MKAILTYTYMKRLIILLPTVVIKLKVTCNTRSNYLIIYKNYHPQQFLHYHSKMHVGTIG